MHNKKPFIQNLPRVLIIGAGEAAEGLIRDLKRSQTYLPVGLLDDNKHKKDTEIHGVKVLGSINEVTSLVKKYKIDLIFIAIPSANSAQMRQIVHYVDSTKVLYRTLPSIKDLISGHVEVRALRKLKIEDLLGRDEVTLSWDKIAEALHGKRVLVSGGAGSIGSELCRQILKLNPAKLLILDNNEYRLYKIELELKAKFPHIPLELALTNITDEILVKSIWQNFKPEIVFHAAAYKHVPLLEKQIRVAVLNNVIGTQRLAEESIAQNVEKFILISSDKAVNPSNIMGLTKRMAEVYCQNINAEVKTQFITVRFGNVLGSIGSVVPLFQKQIKEGGPITVTHPEVSRYFMTIPESCQLILQAMVNGRGGEIFVLDMGEPIKISYLAEQMIRLAGKEPHKDIKIKYIGLRAGEKLSEELFHSSEQLEKTRHEKLFKAKYRKINFAQLNDCVNLLIRACNKNQEDEILILLKSMVPEFNTNFAETN